MTEATVPDTPAALSSIEVLSFFAADHAALAPDAKVYINGGFIYLLRFPTFPSILPTLGITACVRLPFQDTLKNHHLAIGLRGPGGQELPLRVEAQFRAAPGPEAQYGEAGLVPFAVTVTNIEIPGPGTFTLTFSIDHKELATYKLRALQTPMAPASQPTPNDF